MARTRGNGLSASAGGDLQPGGRSTLVGESGVRQGSAMYAICGVQITCN